MKITVDANANETIKFVIHELIHVVLAELVIGKFDLTLEEVLVMGFTDYIWTFVKKSKSRTARWQKLIDKKLAEHAATLPDVPLEELADRRADEPKK